MSEKTKSAEIATKGIRTASQFADLMSALMADLLNETITPEVGHVVCKAAHSLLAVVEMSHRHGSGNFDNVVASPPDKPALPSNGDNSGKIKCNQCDARVSPRMLGEHKKLMHGIEMK